MENHCASCNLLTNENDGNIRKDKVILCESCYERYGEGDYPVFDKNK